MKTSNAQFKANIVSPLADYVDPEKQRINLGVYASDMAYLATFNKFQETIKYFSKIKSMSEQLGILNAIDKNAVERLEKNITNIDSITSITNNSYYNVIDQLKANDDFTLPLITIEGWIESMYIAINLVEKFDTKSPILQRIADRRIVLSNLIAMAETKNTKGNLTHYIETLKSIQSIMNSIEKQSSEVTPKDSSRVIIGNKSTYIITKNVFDNLKELIVTTRAEIIKQ